MACFFRKRKLASSILHHSRRPKPHVDILDLENNASSACSLEYLRASRKIECESSCSQSRRPCVLKIVFLATHQGISFFLFSYYNEFISVRQRRKRQASLNVPLAYNTASMPVGRIHGYGSRAGTSTCSRTSRSNNMRRRKGKRKQISVL